MSRLLFVLDIGFDKGGPSVHLLQDVIRFGLKQGHDLDVILKDTGGPMAVMPNEFINANNFKYFSIKENDEKGMGFIGRYLNEVKYAKKCSKIFLKNGRYDAVFLQSNTVAYFYLRLLKRLGCRIVFNVQDIFPYNLKFSGQLPVERISFPIFRKLQNIAYQKSDCIITISDDMKETLVKDGVNPSKIEVIYNWSYADLPITLDCIEKENLYDLHLDCNKFNVVYAGNIGKMQNVELIARSAINMKDNPQVHFYIIGDGANKHIIENMTSGLKNVTLLPMQPSKFAESIYAQADLNIIPLMPGGIRTALPSKTATILRTDRMILFCIDKNTKFSEKFSKIEGVYFADCNLSESLEMELYKVLEHKNKIYKRDQIDFISTNNASKYIYSMICND